MRNLDSTLCRLSFVTFASLSPQDEGSGNSERLHPEERNAVERLEGWTHIKAFRKGPTSCAC